MAKRKSRGIVLDTLAGVSDVGLCAVRNWWRPLVCIGMGSTLVVNGVYLPLATKTAADLTGADLRGANLAGADLTRSMFVTQAQIDAATGDGTTRLPAALAHPAHWRPN